VHRCPLLIAFAALLLLVGCEAPVPTRAQTAIAGADNVIRIASRRLPPGFANPAAHSGQPSVDIWPAFYDGLTFIEASGEVVPWLATEWRLLSPTRWRFKLRDDVRFSNGERFDAHSVKLAVDQILFGFGARDLVRNSLLPTVAGATLIDNFTIDIETYEPDPLLPKRLSQFYPLPPRYFTEVGPQRFARQPIGTGPFVVERWDAGRVVMRANPTSWRPPAAAGLEFIEIPEPIARRQAIESGQVHIAQYLSAEDGRDLGSRGIEIRSAPEPRLRMIVYVVREGSPLVSPLVRRALNHAINKDDIVRHLLAGVGTVASQIGVQASEGFDHDLAPFAYDPDEARRLLALAGYPRGFELEMDLLVVTHTDRAVFEAILADLRDVGVRVKVNTMEFERWRAKLLSGDWRHDLFSFTVALDPLLDITRAWQYLSCDQARPPFCQPEVSRLIEARSREFDPQRRIELLHEAARLMRADPPAILVHELAQTNGHRGVEGYEVHNLIVRWDRLRLADGVRPR
jgi:peptide/nickel transport system substrate-binding protein